MNTIDDNPADPGGMVSSCPETPHDVVDSTKPWKIIIADDEHEVHNITRMVLREYTFEGRGVTFLSSYTGEETRALVRENPDTALILLDVVMESDEAGLDVVRYIRNDLRNNIIQIILRTGQAGQAPEQEVVERYEINDYKTKYEFTAQKLYTTITSSLRAFRLNNSINRLNAQLREELRERQENEEKIRNLSQFQESVIENAEIWMDVVDENGNVLLWNRAAELISGYSKEDVLNSSSIWPLLYPEREEYNMFAREKFPLHAAAEYARGFESIIRRKDGGKCVIQWTVKDLPDTEGRRVAAISLGQDITEKKQLEKKLLHAQKMEAVGRLAGGVAHDFNNILTVISGYSELALLRAKPGDVIHENISQIRLAAGRAESLTRQLLAFSRKQIMNPSLIDLRKLITEMDKMLTRLIGEDIELIIRMDDDLHNIKADPGIIEQIIMNIVVNARDSMSDGGSIIITLSNNDRIPDDGGPAIPYVMISIADTGSGMDEKVKERIFEPFFTTKDVGKGTGLGLSTVYGIVTQLGGSIDVWSEVGKGSVFTICLAGLDPSEIQASHESVSTTAPGKGETILVIEDQPDVLKLTAEMLRMMGYTVLEASNSGEARQAVENHGPSIDLILADVIMPQQSGREVVEMLKPIVPRSRVLFMSGYSDNIIEQKGIIDRDIYMIRKPFTIENLNRKIRTVLNGE